MNDIARKPLAAHHWIGGKPVIGAEAAPALNPATGERIGAIALGGAAECEAAIEAAKVAFERSGWVDDIQLRSEALYAAAELISARKEELARLLTAETGRLIHLSRAEIGFAVSETRFYAGLARNIFGRMIEPAPGIYSLLAREPAGVAGLIIPWNAPGILLIRSLAPALAAGCTVVVKSAPQSSLFHAQIMRCFVETGLLPDGVVNSFSEIGSAGAEALVRSPDVDVISFTGSSAVGKKIMAAASSTLKRLNLELGGKAPAIVLEDADIAACARKIAIAGMIRSGQQCTAINRVLVHESIYTRFSEALAAALSGLKVGLPTDETADIGPLIDLRSRDRILGLVADAKARGKALLAGGIVEGLPAAGAFVAPSLLCEEEPSSPLVQEEFFGPVLNIERFGTDARAVELANCTRYGLSASVWTADFARAHRIARKLRSGTVWINEHNRLFVEVETGGFRESGFGRLHGVEGLSDFLATKHVFQPHGLLGTP